MKIGYDTKPRKWYQTIRENAELNPQNQMEEVLDELTPNGDTKIQKSHLIRGQTEENHPHEIILERIEEGSFYRETYTRVIDDTTTRQPSLQELKNSDYRIDLMQGNNSASAHRYETIEYSGLPENVQKMFKTHDQQTWWPL